MSHMETEKTTHCFDFNKIPRRKRRGIETPNTQERTPQGAGNLPAVIQLFRKTGGGIRGTSGLHSIE